MSPVFRVAFLAAIAAVISPSAGLAQDQSSSSSVRRVEKKAADIASQPARDLNVSRTEIPSILLKAAQEPYSLAGLKTCPQLAEELTALDGALGTDFQVAAAAASESRTEQIATAGGKAVVNSIIPLRGLVREVSGAAPAERAMRAATNAGLARRGFLNGVYYSRKCHPPRQ